MDQVEFKYQGLSLVIQCDENEKMKNICQQFCKKAQIDINNIFFSYNGKAGNQFNEELTFNQMINSIDKNENKMTILVNNINEEKEKQESIIKSNEIICPKCREICKIKFNNYKISLYDCKNGHVINNLSYDEYEKSQNKDLSKIICGNCNGNNMYISFNKEFYKCIDCNINLCLLCKSNHNKNHNIINYKQLNYMCGKHSKEYTNYCKKCKINLCMLCNNEHKDHDNIFIGDIILNKNELEKKINEIKENIDKFNNNINEIIEMINEVKRNINKYYEIIKEIINNYNMKNINYEILFNLKEIIYNNSNIINDLNEINDDKNNINKFNNIINIYNKIKNNKLNEIKLILDIKKEDINKDIYFLDNTNGNFISYGKREEYHHDFLKELNEINTELYINDIKYKYKKYFKPDKEGIYYIRIKLNIQIKDCSYMFCKCNNLIDIDLSQFDTKNVTNMICMFICCKNLKSIDLSSFDTKNVTDMGGMFKDCNNLKSIELSSFDTKNVTNMNSMFFNCNNLIDFNLSSFDTKNVADLGRIFKNCNNLKSIDLFRFDTKNVTKMNSMFNNCKNLIDIDLSSFDIQNSTDIKDMFYNCNSLKKIILNKNSYNKIKDNLGIKDIEIKLI